MKTVEEVLSDVFQKCTPTFEIEKVSIKSASGRVLSGEVVSSIDLPRSACSSVDGFATDGSGSKYHFVHTGSRLPTGTDRVIKAEDTEDEGGKVRPTRVVEKYENVRKVGTFLRDGSRLFTKGHRLGHVDLGVLGELGYREIEVFRKPRVSLVPVGDELVDVEGSEPDSDQIFETNSIVVSSLLISWGAEVEKDSIIKDDPVLIRSALEAASSCSDLIIMIGGTSFGRRDWTVKVMESMGEVIARGVDLSPGRPTSIGFLNTVPVVCLSGFPASCLGASLTLVKPVINYISGSGTETWDRVFKGILEETVETDGRYSSLISVCLDGTKVIPLLKSRVRLVEELALADGYVFIPRGITEVAAGTEVEVRLFD